MGRLKAIKDRKQQGLTSTKPMKMALIRFGREIGNGVNFA